MAEERLGQPTDERSEQEGHGDEGTIPSKFSAHGDDEDAKGAPRARHNEGHNEGDGNDEPSIEDARTMRGLVHDVQSHLTVPDLLEMNKASHRIGHQSKLVIGSGRED